MQTSLRDRIHNMFSRFAKNLRQLASRRHGVSTDALDKAEGPRYVLGCSATAAGDITGTGERSAFPNIYPGTLPPEGSWGTFTDDEGDTYTIHPVIASATLMQKRWLSYQSTAPDPDWEPLEDVLGGYMHSSQSAKGYIDGDTGFYTNVPDEPDD